MACDIFWFRYNGFHPFGLIDIAERLNLSVFISGSCATVRFKQKSCHLFFVICLLIVF
jgi:hypothetical protein